MNLWLIFLLSGLVTWGIRLSFILLLGNRPIPPLARRALRFVPPAVLTAIIFPEILQPAGRLDITLGNPRLLAGLAAALVAWRTKNAVLTVVVGMVVLWLTMIVHLH